MASWRAIRWSVLIGLVVGLPGYAQAQARPSVGVVTTLVGEATVARVATAQPQNLKMRDDVFPQDRIITKERSTVHVLMGGKALLTVRELSVVTVTEEGGRATVDLQSGKVGLAVVRERMRPGDVIEVQTPHAVAAVRGTVLVVEIVPGPAGDRLDSSGGSTNVHLLHGKLDVSLRSNPGIAPVRLESLQAVTVSRDVLGTMRPLGPAAAGAATTGLKPSQQAVTAIPEKLLSMVGARQAVLAVATVARLAGSGQTQSSAQKGGGKVESAAAVSEAIVKVSDGGSARDAIMPAADVGEGVVAVIGSGFGSSDGGSRSSGNGGSGSDDGGKSNSGGLSNSGPGSSSGGGKGSSLSSGSSTAASVLSPVQTLLPVNKKKH